MTTVYRLPEEPPVTTVMRPEPDTGERYTRDTTAGVSNWRIEIRMAFGMPGVAFLGWEQVLKCHPAGLVAVEPDPHPTPWTVSGESDAFIDDANGSTVCEINRFDKGYEDCRRVPARRALAQRIVDAVNKAATT